MPCTDPRTVGLKADGKTIAWSQKDYSKEYASFQLPCGQCLECRLSYAREWAVRCVHEAQMHEKNAFITLTYSDEKLTSPKLIYRDFQLFMKKLRKVNTDPDTQEVKQTGVFVTGEYGEKTKRPHWHAIIFNWSPPDGVLLRTTDLGHKVYTSAQLDKLWGNGRTEYGSVTIQSASYCARYATKKLVHGKDDEHDFHPISKKSAKHAIGKRWLERNWADVFSYGRNILLDGTEVPIPRYYEKWLKAHRPTDWLAYVTRVKTEKIAAASAKEKSESDKWWSMFNARALDASNPLTRNQIRQLIRDKKTKELEAYFKL